MLQDQRIGSLDQIKCRKHNEQVTLFSLEEGTKLDDRLLCQTCLETLDHTPLTLNWSKAKQIIEGRHQQLQAQFQTERDRMIQLVMSFKNIADQIKTKLLQTLDEIETSITLWISNLEQFDSEVVEVSQQSLLEELAKIVISQEESQSNNKQQQMLNSLSQCNYNFQSKLAGSFAELLSFDSLQKKQTIIEQVQVEKVNQQQALKLITYQLVQEIKQEEYCYAVAFNNEGTTMAASSNEEIKIWNIEQGQLKATGIVLSGHTNWIYTLVFSKKINWFASSGFDQTIRCWKEIKNNWVSSQPVKQHTGRVYCLLLNRNEDQLISCGGDKSIKVWNVDCNMNELTYDYSLDQHTNFVQSISLNESETSLVSCSSDKSILIWGKGQLNKWEFKYKITKSIDDYGYKNCFINDNIIAWQQYSQGIIHIFELENGIYKEKPGFKIELNKASNDGECLFPSVYNKKRGILIQRHNQFVYIIRQQHDGIFKVESQPINCNSSNNYGGLTDNGEHLVIYNWGTKQFRLYKINYE